MRLNLTVEAPEETVDVLLDCDEQTTAAALGEALGDLIPGTSRELVVGYPPAGHEAERDGIDVHAEHPLRCLAAHQRTDERPVVAALNAIALVTESGHQLGEGFGDPGRRPSALGERRREAVADQRRDDEVIRLRRVQAVGAGIA